MILTSEEIQDQLAAQERSLAAVRGVVRDVPPGPAMMLVPEALDQISTSITMLATRLVNERRI